MIFDQIFFALSDCQLQQIPGTKKILAKSQYPANRETRESKNWGNVTGLVKENI